MESEALEEYAPPKVIEGPEMWPPNYSEVIAWRIQQLVKFREDPALLKGAMEYYRDKPVEFICHWLDTYDPRAVATGGMARMPFVLFRRQADLVEFIYKCLRNETNGLIEKCRDAGATWVSVGISVHMFLFLEGSSVGWGSRKENLVDKIGDPDSIFQKIRMAIMGLPPEFLPKGFKPKEHMSFMRIVNPQNEATITGEAGDDIGRGGRKLIYFKDESAHYPRPESIEAALGDNTRVQIDISSVKGKGTVFHRKREAGVVWEPGQEPLKGRTNVFVFRWDDHPAKTPEWYSERKAKYVREGLEKLFAQEVDRDYSASVEGVIIKPEYIKAAIDAHIKLDLPKPKGKKIGALDVADEGIDKNCFTIRHDYMLYEQKVWAKTTAAESLKLTLAYLDGGLEIEYDCIGVGAGVKSEANRLESEDRLPFGVKFNPWNASATPLFPDKHMFKLPNGLPDKKSPTNKEYYLNIKAQGWNELGKRFEKTWRAVEHGEEFLPSELISIPSILFSKEELIELENELSQATSSVSERTGKQMVNKKPDGARSPNRADSIMMAFWPTSTAKKVAGMFGKRRN